MRPPSARREGPMTSPRWWSIMRAAMPVNAQLRSQLAAVAPEIRAKLDAAGFDEARFFELAATLTEGDPQTRRRVRNQMRGEVTAPRPDEIKKLPPPGSPEHARLAERGRASMAAGELAFCTMAGGMATRMGGIVKALAEVLPGATFLSMRLAENRTASERAGRAIPLWLMTSEATHDPLVAALREAKAPEHVACFMQDLSLRLSPDGSLFHDSKGRPSVHATGHGDLVDALRRSKLLDAFIARGGKHVWITNVDNLGASIDEAVLGAYLESGADVQCEVCAKAGDKGGIPVHAEGKLQVLEEFRLPPTFDPKTVNVFNTNTFLARADALAKTPFSFTFFEVEKEVDGKPAIQFERLIQEITAAPSLRTTYLEVPREGDVSRFLPVKDYEELARRRATIEAVGRKRGMLS
jgi:UTP--glucose-1-phosphate uridylyltransferase